MSDVIDGRHRAATMTLTISRRPDRGSGARYARHGRELVGCKSPVRKREIDRRTAYQM